jgi:hypothetical protein
MVQPIIHSNKWFIFTCQLLLLNSHKVVTVKVSLCYVNSEGPHDNLRDEPRNETNDGPSEGPSEGPHDDPRDEPSDETSEGPSDGPIEGPRFDSRDVPSEWPSDGPSVERFILEDLEEIELEPIGVLC